MLLVKRVMKVMKVPVGGAGPHLGSLLLWPGASDWFFGQKGKEGDVSWRETATYRLENGRLRRVWGPVP
ncbi:hypothetical protein ANAEL_02219 [Anaerolineales bacterium]|nr:hypothetical protein ANAEL_02219 [Anaerolineales bacterium]